MADAKTKQQPAAKPAPVTVAVKRRRGMGPELEPHQIIYRPLITEKGTHQSTRHNAYCFEVNPLASKEQIKDAVADLFSVRVASVRTLNRLGKTKRFRNRPGKLSDWKKAIVTLHEDDRLEFF